MYLTRNWKVGQLKTYLNKSLFFCLLSYQNYLLQSYENVKVGKLLPSFPKYKVKLVNFCKGKCKFGKLFPSFGNKNGKLGKLFPSFANENVKLGKFFPSFANENVKFRKNFPSFSNENVKLELSLTLR